MQTFARAAARELSREAGRRTGGSLSQSDGGIDVLGGRLALTETRPELKCAIREVGYRRRVTSSITERSEVRVIVPRRDSRESCKACESAGPKIGA
jgi:hypothetical protein